MEIEQIESILFEQVGDYPKKLKHIKITHPLMNVHGLVRIQNEYYQWVYTNNIQHETNRQEHYLQKIRASTETRIDNPSNKNRFQ